jgi:L-lactate utilization protein LutB
MVSDFMQVFCTLFLIGLGYFFHYLFNHSTMRLITVIEDQVQTLREEQARKISSLRFDLEISDEVIAKKNKSIERLQKMIEEMEEKVIKEAEKHAPLASDLLSDFI